MMNSWVLHRRVTIACLLSALVLAACDDKRRHQLSDAVSFPQTDAAVINGASCDDVVKAMLLSMIEAQKVRAVGFGKAEARQQYDKSMATIQSLMASDKIYESVKKGSQTVSKSITKNAAMTLVAESWVSIIAHYIDGIAWPTMKITTYTGKRATAMVELVNPEEQAMQAEIESSPEVTQAKDASGQPLVKESEEYWKLVRTMAIRKGFNVPARAVLTLTLQNIDDAWRVESLAIGSVPQRIIATRSIAPATTQPAAVQQPS